MQNQRIFPIVVGTFFMILFTLTIVHLFRQGRSQVNVMVAQEVQRLADILREIDATCKIIDFDHQQNWINFLNVERFAGSEVGSLNMTYPKRWDGPYLQDNPTMQDKEYMVVRTKKGYFVTPGSGVRLANGKVIGKDIILDEDADIEKMATDENFLMYKGQALAVPLPVGVGSGKEVLMENILKADDGLVYNK